MSDFHDIRFPFAVAIGAVGGPQRRTEIVTLISGREERNSPWADSLRRWDAGPGVKSLDDLNTLIAFFEARRGRLHGFRFRDPIDNRSCAPSAAPSMLDQLIGTGDGVATEFQLVKHYASGGESWTRTIAKPVEDTVVVAVDGVEAAVSVDHATGQVSFAAPPADGAAITAGFAFDCPVRFDTDRLDIALDAVGAGEAPSVPLVELKL
ncbi:TIGR02217 family protein [Maricaulis sp.]|uniref:phage distal tail protein, Rcc01695 family n=1 Tax=Maricaulis sp. TaxID=1486257 RepID=UPI003A8E8B9C